MRLSTAIHFIILSTIYCIDVQYNLLYHCTIQFIVSLYRAMYCFTKFLTILTTSMAIELIDLVRLNFDIVQVVEYVQAQVWYELNTVRTSHLS